MASYFNGEVKEGVHENTFITPRTFETWGKDSVADHRHFLANSYANAWYITPSDMNGKRDYTLVLELTTQQQFYPALFVSLVTVAFLIGYSIVKIILQWKR
mgnify:CR=1 FL=1